MAHELPLRIDQIIKAIEAKHVCPFCWGLSCWKRKKHCELCCGSGLTDVMINHCPTCNGSGVFLEGDGSHLWCDACEGYGAVFVPCGSCNGNGFECEEVLCDLCDAEGNVSFAQRIAHGQRPWYVARLFDYLSTYADSVKERDLFRAGLLLQCLDGISSELEESGLDPAPLFQGITGEMLDEIEEKISRQTEVVKRNKERERQQEQMQARSDIITGAAQNNAKYFQAHDKLESEYKAEP